MNLTSTRKEKLFAVIIAIILHMLIILLFIFYKMVEKHIGTVDLASDFIPALNSTPAQVSFASQRSMPQVITSKVVQPEEDHSKQKVEELDLNKPIIEQFELIEDYSAGKYNQEIIKPESIPLTNNPVAMPSGSSDTMSNEQAVMDILNIKDERTISQNLSASIAQSVQDFAVAQLEEIDKKAVINNSGIGRKSSKSAEKKFTGKDLLKAFCTQAKLAEQSGFQEQEFFGGAYGVNPKSGSAGGSGGTYVPGYIQERAQEFKVRSYSTRLTKALENAFRLYSKERYFDQEIMTSVDITMIIGRDGKISKVTFNKSTGNRGLDEDIEKVILQCEHLPIPKHLNVKEFVYHMPCYVTLNKGYGKIKFTDDNRRY